MNHAVLEDLAILHEDKVVLEEGQGVRHVSAQWCEIAQRRYSNPQIDDRGTVSNIFLYMRIYCSIYLGTMIYS